MKAVDSVILAITSWVVAGLTAAMAVSVLTGVFFRYVLSDALPWPEEAARYAMIWLAWIGGGLALRRGAHIAVDFLVNALPGPLRRLAVVAAQLLSIAFLALVLYYALALTGRVSRQSTIALGVSMQVPYAAMPVGAALMIYHALIILLGSLGIGPGVRDAVAPDAVDSATRGAA